MTSDRTILITGVTGNQGGAVAQALQGTGFHLRATVLAWPWIAPEKESESLHSILGD